MMRMDKTWLKTEGKVIRPYSKLVWNLASKALSTEPFCWITISIVIVDWLGKMSAAFDFVQNISY